MDWHELHECSFCYNFKVYVGTCNLKYKYTKKDVSQLLSGIVLVIIR